MISDVKNIRIFATTKVASGCCNNVLFMKAVWRSVCIRQKAHKSCTTEGLLVHFSKERRGGREVNFFNAIPSVML